MSSEHISKTELQQLATLSSNELDHWSTIYTVLLLSKLSTHCITIVTDKEFQNSIDFYFIFFKSWCQIMTDFYPLIHNDFNDTCVQ